MSFRDSRSGMRHGFELVFVAGGAILRPRTECGEKTSVPSALN